MPNELRISGKDLGSLAQPNFCPRCFWIQRQLGGKLPFHFFPGIFSSIDSYTKKVVHGWFDLHRTAPDWLAPLGEVSGYVNPPHHSKFRWTDPATGIVLTGAADGILVRPDGAKVIVDYKTARHSDAQDGMLPTYVAQLNSYALIAGQTGLGPVAGLALIYCEPETTDASALQPEHRRTDGFRMSFVAQVVPVPLHPQMIPPLLQRAGDIMRAESPPRGRNGCEDCPKVDGLVRLLA